ncbi:MAG: NUDIX domain-containing protein [Micrococcales bacterium]|nr:NUDIX domain-containing protein [Micrococcales bacterium]
MPHRYAPDDHQAERTLLVAAAYVVLLRPATEGEAVLLLRRSGTGYRDGHWAVVAGHVDPGESVVEAALRETQEEAGVRVAPDDLVPLTAVHRYWPGADQVEQRIDMFFAARRWTGQPRLVEPDKADTIGWFPLGALPGPTVPHERLVLDALAVGARLPAVQVWRTDHKD